MYSRSFKIKIGQQLINDATGELLVVKHRHENGDVTVYGLPNPVHFGVEKKQLAIYCFLCDKRRDIGFGTMSIEEVEKKGLPLMSTFERIEFYYKNEVNNEDFVSPQKERDRLGFSFRRINLSKLYKLGFTHIDNHQSFPDALKLIKAYEGVSKENWNAKEEAEKCAVESFRPYYEKMRMNEAQSFSDEARGEASTVTVEMRAVDTLLQELEEVRRR